MNVNDKVIAIDSWTKVGLKEKMNGVIKKINNGFIDIAWEELQSDIKIVSHYDWHLGKIFVLIE